MDNESTYIFFVMGVSGCGKSTIGKLLATSLAIPFFDGDDYHPDANIQKMKAGMPLNDDDRHEWLVRLNELAKENMENGAVIACSALKEKYRIALNLGIDDKVRWVFLEGTFKEVLDRLQKRAGHFMPVELLRSQFDTLEPPQNAITVSIGKTPKAIVSEVLHQLKN